MMEQFTTLLAEFEALGGTGIIYGGCLRDTFCGVGPIKDIDVAVADTEANHRAIDAYVKKLRAAHDEEDEPGSLREMLGFSSVHVTNMPLGYGNFPDVVRSISVEAPGETTVNFVVVDLSDDIGLGPMHPINVAARCDFGICQIAMDGQGEVYVTEPFTQDLQNKTFTYTREPFDQAQWDRSLRRWERLKDKFEGWTLKLPVTGTRIETIITDGLD